MTKTIKLYVLNSQLETIKAYLKDINGKNATKKEINETIKTKMYLYGQMGFDSEVKKMKDHLDLMAQYASLRKA